MLKSERHTYILQQLNQAGVLRVKELAVRLNVSPITIRRDLEALEAEGQLRRVHGGAVLREPQESGQQRADTLEQRIADTAARFIPPNSVLFLGPGPLVREMIPFLAERTDLTIITNALDVAWSAARLHRHTLHLLGGQVEEGYAIYGESEHLAQLRADWIVLQVEGIDPMQGITHDHMAYAVMARELFRSTAQLMALAPPHQVGRAGAVFIAPAEELDVLITGREAANAPLWDLSELGVRIILA
ncbi:MAG TPA: DeoR/GlpR transcriptional regulator [Chloroflexi bacterium]|nr:DeoR/GlpR transcriptional regulator [Chloroflexota bacterium]